MSDKILGIANFWNKAPAEREAAPTDTDANEVRFEGVGMVIGVVVLHGKHETADAVYARATAVLGQCLADLLRTKKWPQVLGVQRIGRTIPLGPKVTFNLPGVCLYADASSTDPELARKRAQDRLALAIGYAQGDPEGKAILERYKVSARRML